MDDFTLQIPTKIIFGRGAEKEVGSEIAKTSRNILFVYGGESIKRTGLYDRVVKSLGDSGVGFTELSGVKPNPRLSLIREGIKICRENKIDFVLAVGGGSAIDTAKAIALGVPYDGDVWDFFASKADPVKSLPVGTILTIPASGSESSNSCVITNEDGWLKRGRNSQENYPMVSFLNPELAFTLPKYQVMCGVTDIMSHYFERYFTNSQNVELIDRMIEAAVKTVINNARDVLTDSDNYEAWAQIMWAGTLAHNNILSTGRVSDWGSHAVEHEISAIYDVAHGAGLAVVIPAWMKYVYKHDVNRFAQFAVRVFNVDNSFWDAERTALEGISRLESFFHSLGLTTSLKTLTGADDRLEEMADKCTNWRKVGNFVQLRKDDVYNILKLAL